MSPVSVFKFLLEKAPEVLLGGMDRDGGQRLLEAYWGAYRETHGSHKVFTDHEGSLRTVVPICLHGDEGRGVRRGNTCVVTAETVFGLGTCDNIQKGEHYGSCTSCTCTSVNLNEKIKCKTPAANTRLASFQEFNLKHHCFLTKYLLFVLPNEAYKETDLLHTLLEQIYRDLRQLYYEGIYFEKQYWHFALVGLKGDLAWFAKIGNLSRCFKRLADVAPMCHECGAGSATQPFEDCQEYPAWRTSIYATRPWEHQPTFVTVPFDSSAPEQAIRRDLFHNSKCGVFRDFIGSAVLLLCHLQLFHEPPGEGVSNARKVLLQRAHGHFRLFCNGCGLKAALRSFTPDFLNCRKIRMFPWINCKGSDSMILIRWLAVATHGFLTSHPEHTEILRMIYGAARAARDWMSSLYSHGLWLTRGCAYAIYREGRRFLLQYNALAYESLHGCGFQGFAMKPKVHMLAHTLVDFRSWLDRRDVELIPSPLMWSCESNEDNIGRVSRVSRRMHQASVCTRTLEAYLIKSKALHTQFKRQRLKRKRED